MLRSIAIALNLFTVLCQLVSVLAWLFMITMFVGTWVTLLKGWIGFWAYIAWVPAAIVGSPLILIYPWFSAWVAKSPVLDADIVLWLVSLFTGGVVFLARLAVVAIVLKTKQEDLLGDDE